MKVTDAISLYLDHLTSLSRSRSYVPRTKSSFCYFTNFCSLHELNDIRDVTSQHLIDYGCYLRNQKGRGGQPLHRNTCNEYLRLVKRLFCLLHERELLLTDITIALPVLHGQPNHPRYVPSADQVMTLLRTPALSTPKGFRDRTILELLYSTGLRGSELCDLKLYDIDLVQQTLRVNQAKGNKDRLVPLGRVACRYLQQYLKRVRPLLVCDHVEETALFISIKGTALKRRTLFNLIRHYCGRADLPGDISGHSLRHACAVGMLRGGANVRYIQELLGHSRLSTTQIYTQLTAVDIRQVHSRTAPSERRVAEPLSVDISQLRMHRGLLKGKKSKS